MTPMNVFADLYKVFEIPEIGEYEVLIEIFQGAMNGYALEICEINEGERYTLVVTEHNNSTWNIDGDFQELTSRWCMGEQRVYGFPNKAGAVEAVAVFMRLAI